jgi:transcriptional regulator with XRE-family HTH domain
MPPAAGRTHVESIEVDNFARRLHEEMNKRGWSNSDLARAVWGETKDKRGYTVARNRDRVGQYVSGKSFPDPKNLSKIAVALNVDPNDLAPDAMGAAIDKEKPAIQMTAVAGHYDKVHLTINTVVPLLVATKVIDLLAEQTNDD